jgi:hypothetical protein
MIKAETVNDSTIEFAGTPAQMTAPAKPEVIEHKFTVHKAYICHYSRYFRNMYGPPSLHVPGYNSIMPLLTSGKSDSYIPTFNDIPVGAFGIFVNWLYHQTIQDAFCQIPDLLTLARVWVLGKRFSVPKLQNAAIYQIRSRLSSGPGPYFGEFMNLAYEGGGNVYVPLARMAVHYMVMTRDKGFFRSCLSKMPAAMMITVLKDLKEQQAHKGIPLGAMDISDCLVPDENGSLAS